MKKGKKIIAVISVIAVLIYIIASVYLLIVHPTDKYVVKQGELLDEDEAIGYIIRNEIVVQEEGNKNGIYAIASEGQRVAVGESIFRYYSNSEKEIKTQISGLNYKIQELLEQEKIIPSADIKAIEKQIEQKIKSINKLSNYQEIVENKNNIDNLITKKINFISDVTENKEIKTLVKERNTYEGQLKNGAEYKKAEMAGVVSYRVDGLENKLSPAKFNEINEKYLNSLDTKTGKIISTSNESGKVMDNFKCYIAITMNSKKAKEAKVGDTVQLRIANADEQKAEIIHINEESGKRTIIFEMNAMTEYLRNHRKIAVDVIWWKETGLKVPKQALIKENGLYYVIRNKAGIEAKLLVNLKAETDKLAIIEAYDSEGLEKLGYDSTQIKNYKKISNYDEIIIKK